MLNVRKLQIKYYTKYNIKQNNPLKISQICSSVTAQGMSLQIWI